MQAWRARAARSYPSDLRAAPRPVRLTLLAALCWVRSAEITDALVDLLIGLVHKINARAERRVERELIDDLRRVRGKEGILFRLAEAAVEHPDDTVREALFPVVGEKTLRELVARGQGERAGIPGAGAHRAAQLVLDLLPADAAATAGGAGVPVQQHRLPAGDGRPGAARALRRDRRQGPLLRQTDRVPLDGVVPKAWREAVVDDRGRVERIPYELCVLVALRDALRRREIYVSGGNRWRNPEDDLPGDFDATREVHYAAIRQPLDPTEFIADLRRRMTEALIRLDHALVDGSAGVAITTRRGEPWIMVPRLEALPEPANLGLIKDEVIRRWGTLDLLDVLKDADFLAEFTDEFTSVASREVIDRDTLRRRLLLCLFALGTNMGIKAIVATGEHGEARPRCGTCAGTSSPATTCAAPSPSWSTPPSRPATRLVGYRHARARRTRKKFGSWESNLMTEYHQRYGGPGVMIYWHVERRSICIYSQLKSCSSSEVAAMIEGLLRHCTDAEIDANYVDTHGASVVGFAFTELLGFRLLPRLKNIGAIRLYRPDEHAAYARLPLGAAPGRFAGS